MVNRSKQSTTFIRTFVSDVDYTHSDILFPLDLQFRGRRTDANECTEQRNIVLMRKNKAAFGLSVNNPETQ